MGEFSLRFLYSFSHYLSTFHLTDTLGGYYIGKSGDGPALSQQYNKGPMKPSIGCEPPSVFGGFPV